MQERKRHDHAFEVRRFRLLGFEAALDLASRCCGLGFDDLADEALDKLCRRETLPQRLRATRLCSGASP